MQPVRLPPCRCRHADAVRQSDNRSPRIPRWNTACFKFKFDAIVNQAKFITDQPKYAWKMPESCQMFHGGWMFNVQPCFNM